MEVLNMLYICKASIHMFLMYCLVNQAFLELHVVQMIVITFYFGRSVTYCIIYYIKLDRVTLMFCDSFVFLYKTQLFARPDGKT